MTEEKLQLDKFISTVINSSAYPKFLTEMIDAANKNEDLRISYGDEVYNKAVRLMQSTIGYDFDTCLQICQEKRAKELIDELRSSLRVSND